jgi:ABC-type dipeptide/oligopeptide/nickel transport system permease subunit
MARYVRYLRNGLGLLAGYLGGVVNGIMPIMDALMGFPMLIWPAARGGAGRLRTSLSLAVATPRLHAAHCGET